MDRELCFCIEGKNLYLEQVLVDYMEIPIFFLCKNANQYYIALCTNIEESDYIVVQASSSAIYHMLHGESSMRDVILKQKEYWDVSSGEKISTDTVNKYSMDKLDVSLLPEKDACFEVLTEEMEKFVRKFDDEFFDDGYIDKNGIWNNWNEIPIIGNVDICNCNIGMNEFFNLGVCFPEQHSVSKTVSSYQSELYSEKKAMSQSSDRLEGYNDEEALAMAA